MDQIEQTAPEEALDQPMAEPEGDTAKDTGEHLHPESEADASTKSPLYRWPEPGIGGTGAVLVPRRAGRKRWIMPHRRQRYTQLPRWLSEMLEGYQTYTMGLTLLGNRDPPHITPSQAQEASRKGRSFKHYHRFFTPSLERLYANRQSYLAWLAREYDRYRAGLELLLDEGLERPPADQWLTPEEVMQETRHEEDLNASLAEELSELDAQYATEVELIKAIAVEDWRAIALSRSPGLALAIHLGADTDILNQDLTNAASLGLFSRLAATRTDFLSFEGPKAWYEEELGQIHKVVEGLAGELMGEMKEALGAELKRELPDETG